MRAPPLFVLVGLGIAMSCGSKGPVGELGALVDELCACKTDGCVSAAKTKLEGLQEKYRGEQAPELDDSQQKEVSGHLRRMAECESRAAGQGVAGDYIRRSKQSEAKTLLRNLARGAADEYATERFGVGGLERPQLPGPSAGPTPAIGSCCADGKKKCEPRAAEWAAPTWVALGFSIEVPHYFSYQYEVSDDRKSAKLSAFGDLDCDGQYSTFWMVVTVSGGEPTMGELQMTSPDE